MPDRRRRACKPSNGRGVLAACGKLTLLQRADDLGGGESFGGLRDGCETVHGGIKHGLGLDESEYFLVEKGFEQCGGDNASGQSGSHRIGASDVGHVSPPEFVVGGIISRSAGSSRAAG